MKRDLIALSYIVNDFSQMYGTTARDIRKLLARVNNFHPDRLAAVKAYLDCEYVTDRDTSDEKTYRWSDFLGIAAGAVRTSASTGVERNGLHFYFGDEPKPAPEFFRERHSKTRPIVCLETGEAFEGNPAAARPLHVSPAAISQAVRDGTPIDGLHFYHGDEPKPAPEFFKPAKGKGGKSPAQMAAAARAAAGSSGRPDGGQRQWRAVQ